MKRICRTSRRLAATVLLGMAMPMSAWCQAVAAPEKPAAEPVVAVTAVAAIATKPATAFGAAVGLQRLTNVRGGASTTSTQVDIGGTLKDNSATNVATGNNAIREGSFANAVGMNTVIQNSGANVLIQNSMTVIVQFK